MIGFSEQSLGFKILDSWGLRVFRAVWLYGLKG